MGVLKIEKFVKCEIIFLFCGLEDGKLLYKLKREVYWFEFMKDKLYFVVMIFYMFSKVIFFLDENNIFGIMEREVDIVRE